MIGVQKGGKVTRNSNKAMGTGGTYGDSREWGFDPI